LWKQVHHKEDKPFFTSPKNEEVIGVSLRSMKKSLINLPVGEKRFFKSIEDMLIAVKRGQWHRPPATDWP